ncbi:hypothetical protein RW092_00115 [Paenibacillus sp. 3LSP]|uniref:hypothetical protein n=1 Tax=Paenibacillus sp. 3LSP TaxID=2800795 RepID=UPI0028FD8D62|nr:hypothetical protein [Paenibacillus sp. 3LSP]MDU0328608.1 hypothetical protein [Paenibacillus sp. 3LSP]
MGKVIDAEGLVNFLEEEKNNWEGQNPYSRGRSDSLQWVIDRIKSNNSRIGIIDSIPLPTINPGDKVKIISALSREWIGREAVVKEVYTEPFLHFSLDICGGHWTPSCLEVIESD